MGRTTTINRITLFLGLVVFTLFGTAFAQSTAIVATHIGTSPGGIRVEVEIDGQIYHTPVTFSWLVGSRHRIHTYDQFDPAGAIKWSVTGGSDSFTADPNITEVLLSVAVSYRIGVVFAACGSPSPGTVAAGGNAFSCTGSFFAPAGVLSLSATANPGWVFAGWFGGPDDHSQSIVGNVTVNGPISVYPRFVLARKITLQSSPSGLQVLADRTPVNTPISLEWGANTPHALGSYPDQLDNTGKLWVFDSWSDGGGINHSYLVPDGLVGLSVTANYVPGQRVTFNTNPPGLQLSVDGRTNWLSYNFAWAANSQHTVSAPLTQTDANGTAYVFKGWSQGGEASQIISATPDPNGLNLQFTANYEGSGRVTITSETPGVVIQVDSKDCALPCTIEKSRGTPIHLTAPRSLGLGDDARLDLVGWNDVADADRVIAAPGGPLKLTLSYRLRNRLSVTANPPEGARLVTDPASPDGFFDAGAQVNLSVETKLGFKFLNWDGDLSGTSRSLTVNMSSPRIVRAILDRIPALLDNAVRNGAGDTPANAVAAGSIISVYGVNLASDQLAGPLSPLAQTLNNVTVRIGGRLLPLLFVSPGQINAELPSDLAEGSYTLTVRWEGKPDVSADFQVVRNAPGLFNNVIDGKAYGLFLHENGDPVTLDSPAHRGETVTLLGTGFGPYLQAPPDGFGVPESDTTALADAVTILTADTTLDSLYAGVAAGRAGMTAVRFKIGDNLASGSSNEIRVRVLEQESNTVLLPVE